MKFLIILSTVLFISQTQAQHRLKGSIKDGNGKVPIIADVHITAVGSQTQRTWSCSAEGSFDAVLPSAGIYQLRASAANHQEISLPLIIQEVDKDITVTIQLEPNKYEETIEKVRIIGDWNNFKFSGTDQMTKDGAIYAYTRTAEGDTLSYQLLDIAGGHSVNGTHADYLVYDGGGDYRSVIRTKKGEQVTITFDPAKIRFDKREGASVVFPGNTFLNTIYTIHSTTAKMNSEAMVIPTGGGAATMSQAKYNEIIDYLRSEFERNSPPVSHYAAVKLAEQFNPTMPFDRELAQKILQAVPANSPMWTLAPQEVLAICESAGPEIAASYKAALATTNPSAVVRAMVYAEQLGQAYSNKDEKETRRLYALVKEQYGTLPEMKYVLMQYNPDAAVQVGRKVPEFELEMLGSSMKVSNTSLLGKYYLIDFWATWCGPCVREMPAIHKAYERFKGRKGFEILSISMDGGVGQIAPFRQKWPMPWLHVFIPGVFDAEIAKRFEVAGIPKPILVDPQGAIVAMESNLRGEDLERTLESFLGGDN